MSKYVRTKNNVYELVRDANDWVVAVGSVQKQLGCKITISKSSILKQADTIEGLCDGYYVDVNDQSFTLSECYDNLEDAKKSYKDWISYSDRKYLEYVVILYAFIKTNKGLIYVAKMNGKGELELL